MKNYCILALIQGEREINLAIFESEENARAFAMRIPGYRAQRVHMGSNDECAETNKHHASEVKEHCETEAKKHRETEVQNTAEKTENEHRYMLDEIIQPSELPDYIEIEYKTCKAPLSRFMFEEDEPVMVIYEHLSNMDAACPEIYTSGTNKKTMITGSAPIDAYVVENNKIKEYVEKREKNYSVLKAELEKRGYEVSRAHRGSEDGEAAICRKSAKNSEVGDTSSAKHEPSWHFLGHLDPNFVYDFPQTEHELKEYINFLLGN